MLPGKISVRAAFETLIDQLREKLKAYGFHILGSMPVQDDSHTAVGVRSRYHVLIVDLPRVTAQMLAGSPNDGMIFPCCISLVEVYPGQIEMYLVNPTEMLAVAGNNVQLLPLAREVTHLLEYTLNEFAADPDWTPDLITSWG